MPRLIKKKERSPIGFVKEIENVGPTSQRFSDFKRETKEKIEQKKESLYSSLPTRGKRIKKYYLVQLYMTIYTVHFNRLIGEQFVLQYKHLLAGFRFETPQAPTFMLSFRLSLLVCPETNKTA